MKESEIRILFQKISNRYSNFAFDDFKVDDWTDLLKDVPSERATENLRRYCLNPENQFPPHPGILAEKPVQRCEGNYIPDAQETRRTIKEKDKLLLGLGPSELPKTSLERMKKLGYRPSGRYQ